MKDTDILWIDKWSKELYDSIGEVSSKEGMPVCFASFAQAMGTKFEEGVTILDYGCGPARFFNFMSKRLKNFMYYGIEPDSAYGINCINNIRNFYKKDKRISVGLIGTDVEQEALEQVDIVLLCSIFTHITIEQTKEVLYKLYPIVNRGGIIVFSMILGDEYKVCEGNAYSMQNTYSIVYNTIKQIQELNTIYNIKLEDEWMSPRGHLHKIYKIGHYQK
jgi:hypothetical protein